MFYMHGTERYVFVFIAFILKSFCVNSIFDFGGKVRGRARIPSATSLVRTIARLCQYDILSVAAKYGIYRLDNSVSFTKKSVWKTFAASVV